MFHKVFVELCDVVCLTMHRGPNPLYYEDPLILSYCLPPLPFQILSNPPPLSLPTPNPTALSVSCFLD